MKQGIVVFLAFMLMTVAASAQVNPSAAESGLSYSKRTFYMDGKAIPGSQLSNVIGEDLFQTYRKAKGLRTAGIVCTATGGTLLTGGLIGVISAATSDSTGDIFVGGFFGTPCALLGCAVAIPGVVMWCVGSSRIKRIPVTFNSKNRTAYLTPSSSGMGLALNF